MTTTRADCEALDRSDVLAGKRAAFLLPKGVIYLDGNSLGVLPRNVPARVQAAVEREWGETLIKSWNEHGWFHLPQKIGGRLERLIGAEPGSVIVGDTISVNLFKILTSALGQRRERKVILSDSGNFPSDLYVAQGLTQFMADGHEVRIVAPEDVAASITPEVAVVMLTEVDYRTARRHDMKAITRLAHEAGALMIWDLAHSAGAVPVDLQGERGRFRGGLHLQVSEWRTRCAGFSLCAAGLAGRGAAGAWSAGGAMQGPLPLTSILFRPPASSASNAAPSPFFR